MDSFPTLFIPTFEDRNPMTHTPNRRLVIGLTGGIASGKSTVADILADRGIPIIDADQVARELVEPGQSALEEIIAAFGTGILDASGRLDRGVLRERVFSAPGDRQRLEDILHPRIGREMSRRADAAAGPYCVLAIPLLLETGTATGRIDRILVVDTPVERQMERACQRDGSSPAIVREIIRAQTSREKRLAAAHDVIRNDSDLRHLRDQVMALHHRYLEMGDGHRAA
uniref:Dephospho-CoA kinase n=1 Tax=Candidatus Kentrum sp. DK TaxID=2126562 RepID=A0A450RVS4_9GAMM|nr:MAG: dephospho-CoA kinase [Candidatus Kentron sp. DK]